MTTTGTHPLVASPAAAAYWAAGQLLWVLAGITGLTGLGWMLSATTDITLITRSLASILSAGALLLLCRRAFAAAAFRTPGALAGTLGTWQDPPGIARVPRIAQAVSLAVHALQVTALVLAVHWTTTRPALTSVSAPVESPVTARDLLVLGILPTAVVMTVGVLGRLARDLSGPAFEDRSVAVGHALCGLAGTVITAMLCDQVIGPEVRSAVWSVALTLGIGAPVVLVCVRVVIGGSPDGGPRVPSTLTAQMDKMADAALTWWKGAATLDDRARYRPWIKRATVVAVIVGGALLMLLPKAVLALALAGGGLVGGYWAWERHTTGDA